MILLIVMLLVGIVIGVVGGELVRENSKYTTKVITHESICVCKHDRNEHVAIVCFYSGCRCMRFTGGGTREVRVLKSTTQNESEVTA